MLWLKDLGTVLGGSTLLATGLYGGSVALEKVLKPARREELTRFVVEGGFHANTTDTATVVLTLFDAMFGARQFTLKFALRSCALTTIVVIVLAIYTHEHLSLAWLSYDDRKLMQHLKTGDYQYASDLKEIAIVYSLNFIGRSFVADYLSLLKGRVALRYMVGKGSVVQFALVCFDVTCSAAISALILYAAVILGYMRLFGLPLSRLNLGHIGLTSFQEVAAQLWCTFGLGTGCSFRSVGDLMASIFFVSTLFTSVWVVLVSLSAAVLRLLFSINYLVRLTNYLFDVEKKPVEALGIVASALAFLGSVLVHAF